MIEAGNPFADLFPQLDRPILQGKPLPGTVPVFPGPLHSGPLHSGPLRPGPRYRKPLYQEFQRQESPPPRTSPLGFHPAVLLPFFLAVLGGLNLGTLAASWFLFPPEAIAGTPELPGPSGASGFFEAPDSPEAPLPFEGLSSAFLLEPEIQGDLVMDSFRNPGTRDWVIGFFERICGSLKTAQAILEEAEGYSISPSLAFALSWEESRFNYRAVNRKNRDGSVDRGLFQLNSRSFPQLGEADFFDPRLNASYGMAHLRICIDTGGSEITALAMYNAGTSRVRSGGTPRQTLDYTARILSSRRKIDRVFLEEWARRPPTLEEAPLAADQEDPPAKARETAARETAFGTAPEAGGFPLPIPLSPLSFFSHRGRGDS